MKTANQPIQRKFIPNNFSFKSWPEIEKFYEILLLADIADENKLEHWLQQLSELEAFLEEHQAWLYINMTCHTNESKHRDAYNSFVSDVLPQIAIHTFRLKQKLVKHPDFDSIKYKKYYTYFRKVAQDVLIFNEKNANLEAKVMALASEYSAIMASMQIEYDLKTLSVTQAAVYLKDTNRLVREAVWKKIAEVKLQHSEKLDAILTEQIALRHEIAINAGFKNYRDYMFAAYGRFDYTVDACFAFHKAIASLVMPLRLQQHLSRKTTMGLESLKPWDLKADSHNLEPLKPFATGVELLEKGIQVMFNVDPYFANCLTQMKEMGHFDLEARPGKAPGGYNYPLPESGAPFIFMNASGTLDDVITWMHEAGHAVHSFLSHGLPLNALKAAPMEVAEVASMAMELLSMAHWSHFFKDNEDLKRAKLGQLERTISILPWIATVDAFQHWLYLNPTHTVQERHDYWQTLLTSYVNPGVDYTGLESFQAVSYQSQLHIYEVPFYYIEYGIAQLAALGIWKASCEDKEATLVRYKSALKLGFTKTIPEIYEAFGLKFDFSEANLQSLMEFVAQQEALLNEL